MYYNPVPQLPKNGITIKEFFSGGGLLAAGFVAAGFQPVYAIDNVQTAVDAYRHNICVNCECADITQKEPHDMPESNGIIGGPPCQDFSIANKFGKGEHGEKGKLVWDYLDKISALRPEFFLFENVDGLLSKKNRPTFNALIDQFKAINYRISWSLIDAWDYGVAQHRNRVIIVGIRHDLGFTYEFPEPKEWDYQTMLLRDVIGDLPSPDDSCGGFIPANHEPQELSETQVNYLLRNPDSYRKNRPVTMLEPSRTVPAVMYKGVPYGLFFPHNHTQKDYWFPKAKYAYDQANRIMDMDKPSATVPAHHNSGQPIHPLEAPRRYTIREALRVQSVPDWYVMPDHIKLGPAYRIVGNGVPTKLAYELAIALADQLSEAKSKLKNEV